MHKRMLDLALSPVFEKYAVLMRTLAVYLALLIVMDYLNLTNTVYLEGKAKPESGLLLFFTSMTSWVIYVMVAVTCHRIFLLGEQSVPKWGLFVFSKREWSFLISGIGLGLLVGGVSFLFLMVGMTFSKPGVVVGVIAMGVASAVIISRVSLVFPAISVDERLTFADAWNLTRDYKLFVFVWIVLFPILFSVALGLVYGLVIQFISAVVHFNFFFLYSVLNIVITIFTVSALSATYKFILEEQPEAFEPAAPPETPTRGIVVEEDDAQQRVVIHDRCPVTFDELKTKLKAQYLELGLANTVIDKETSWMIKHPQNPETYVLLSHKEDEYVIEVFRNEPIAFLDALPCRETDETEGNTHA